MCFVLILLLVFTGACSQLNKKAGLSDNNQIEEKIEELIEEQTGLKIDLTPESPES